MYSRCRRCVQGSPRRQRRTSTRRCRIFPKILASSSRTIAPSTAGSCAGSSLNNLEVTEALTAEEALERVLEKGEQYELVVMDQHFDAGTMTGSEAIAQLRAKGAGREVIILCSGNNSQSTTGKAANSVQADATWGKPWPDWRNGDMQRQLAPLFAHARP
mmetsp:Transcript_24973/g.63635  ORF Transcript_24973/g.63635 Transcript_24973/m.63635 type:complete len:160 (-) Transcript_24973:262-741(-)